MSFTSFLSFIGASILFALVAPLLGCLLSGIDRKISARMQGRIGPSILQPYYDLRKLLVKERGSVSSTEATWINLALLFCIFAGGIFFAGGNLLLCIFLITLSSLFFIVAGYSTRSPYAELGSAREIVQVMSYEPMVLLFAVAFYMVANTFETSGVFVLKHPVICFTGLIFLGLFEILTIKLRKSPFDLSSSHHAHQELVKGITTEMSGSSLAKVEIMHWAESVLFLAWIGLFFVYSNPWSILLALVVMVLIYGIEIWIDNNFARVRWQTMFKCAWATALILGAVNLVILYIL